MTDENVHELQGLQAEAAGLHQMIEKVNSQVPSRVDGFDPTGTVSVVVGADGLPDAIHVNEGWSFQLAPERLGEAVMGAFTAAFYERLRAWTTAFDAEDLDAPAAEDPAADDPIEATVTDPEEPRARASDRPRDPEAFALAVLEALDEIGDAGEPAEGTCGVGSVADGCLELTLTGAGLISCYVEPGWAIQCTGEELTEAFNAALGAARDGLVAATAASPSGRLRQLLDEGFAILDEAGERPPLTEETTS